MLGIVDNFTGFSKLLNPVASDYCIHPDCYAWHSNQPLLHYHLIHLWQLLYTIIIQNSSTDIRLKEIGKEHKENKGINM